MEVIKLDFNKPSSETVSYVCYGEENNFNFSKMLNNILIKLNSNSCKNKVVLCCTNTFKRVHEECIINSIKASNMNVEAKHFTYKGIIFRDMRNFIRLSNTELAIKLGFNSAALLLPSQLSKEVISQNNIIGL